MVAGVPRENVGLIPNVSVELANLIAWDCRRRKPLKPFGFAADFADWSSLVA
jgi:hypothetical protein